MLKIVYPICCGIDVHKTFVVACLAITDDKNVTTYQRKRFSTFTNDLKKLAEWLELHSCFDVCMESTGKYWIPVYNLLESSVTVTLAHPKYVKAIRGKKTDAKDAQWIADLFKHDLVAGSFMPPPAIRHLRDLMRYRSKLTNAASSEKNRFQNSLTVSNIQIASVVSDTFGKSAMKIIQCILDNPDTQDIPIETLIHGSMKDKVPDLRLAIDGVITPEQAAKLTIIKEHFDAITLCKNHLEDVIKELATEFSDQIALIQTHPGFKNPFSAIAIISEIGVDMSQFPTSQQLCSWAGLTPTNNESAGKKKSVRISKAGCYIKPLLVQLANSVIKSPKYPEYRETYLTLKKRRGHKRAIIAIARKMLTALYHMLRKKEVYTPYLAEKINQIPETRTISVEQAIEIAQKQGFKVAN